MAFVTAASARTERLAGVVGEQRLRARLLVEVVDLVLSREHAGLLGVGRVQLQMIAADLVARPRDERRARRQLTRRRASASASSSAT